MQILIAYLIHYHTLFVETHCPRTRRETDFRDCSRYIVFIITKIIFISKTIISLNKNYSVLRWSDINFILKFAEKIDCEQLKNGETVSFKVSISADKNILFFMQ